ncbi:MAG TPA: pyruvate kinase [Gemmatimonadales bacterium]|nr:pyruvate kinase [Gemmatimonadales bacterium]
MSPHKARFTKIVATLGPAWSSPDRMHALLDGGVNVVRINASHGTPAIREQWISDLQRVLAERKDAAAILLDVQGPRIRVGDLAEPITLAAGQEVVFAPEAVARPGEIPTTYDDLATDVKVAARILLDDGLLSVEVTGISGVRVRGVVRYGGLLKSHKGMNLPGIQVSAPSLTDKDREDLAMAGRLGVDYVALSFVRRREDMEELRKLLPRSVKTVAKIEKDTALLNLEAIIDASDAIMVARGDLGVELPFEEVPLVQKRIIREANLRGKPVITATQMLESMVHAPRPTRAEASDVANAILDGTDAVMLSAETAVGDFPLEAVQAMDRIAREMEANRRGRSPAFDLAVGRRGPGAEAATGKPVEPVRQEDAIGVATVAAAELLKAPLVVCFTVSGFTARKVAAYRPAQPIFALTTDRGTYRQLCLVWGVVTGLADHLPSYDEMLSVARQQILERHLAAPGDKLVVTAGVPFDVPGTTNLLKIEAV